MKNVLDENDDIWIKKWVRITEPEEIDKNKKKNDTKIFKCKFPTC